MNAQDGDPVRARFDQVAADWDAKPERVALARGVVAAIRDAVPLRRDMNVMDFGAGTGLVTLGLLPSVGRITAVDASPGMVRVLEDKLKALGIAHVQTRGCDIAQAAFPAAEFDLIVSSMVLHHLPDVPHTLRRLGPCLKPGGWLALADLDAEDGTFHADATGVFHHGFERDQIRRWLEAAGLRDTAAREAYRIVRPGPDGQSRVYPVFLVTGRAA